MFFFGIFFETLHRLRRPAADLVHIVVFSERRLLNVQQASKIIFGGRSDLNHD